ncbi:MAG: ABC transporter-like protein [Marinobacter sp. T13-3]|nr:MAG: ABC transporter-like protein [Marinobacter sp. T13-3]
MNALIQVNNLRFAYGDAPVLEDISLDVNAGEIIALVGADGAGKSTLLQLLVGQLEPDEGELRVLGLNPTNPDLRSDLAYMPQGFGLYLDLSVQENLAFFADLHGMDREHSATKIRDLLARTGLNGFEDRRAGQLSGGMMQKLALACALVTEPKVMFLDEPTTGVDPVSRRAFWRLLEAVRNDGVAILYATANMDEAERCDRVTMLDQGQVIRQGTPLALVAETEGQLVSVQGKGVRGYRDALREFPGVAFVFPVGPRLNVWLHSGIRLETFREQLASNFSGLEVQPLTPTLHDAAVRQLASSEEAGRGS